MGRAVILGLALAVAGCGETGDLAIRQRVTESGLEAKPREEMQYLTATRRITDTPHTRSIVDLRAETLTTFDKDKRTYWVVTFEKLRRESVAQQRRLRDAPPAIRDLLDPPVTLAPTGKHERIAGHDAEEYSFSSGEMTGSVWVTEDLRVPLEGPEWQKFVDSTGAPQGPAGKLAEAMTRLEGLPLRATSTIALGEVKATVTTEVLEVRRQAPPPEALAIPEGFRKVDPPLRAD